MSNPSPNKTILPILLVVVVAVIGYYILNAPDRRTPGQKISDAVNELPNGLDKAGRQLESRTPGQKLSDEAHDAAQDLKKATNQQ